MSKHKDWIVRYYASHDDIPEGHTDGEFQEELVRCKDCTHKDAVFGICMENSRPVEPTDFCSWGERKEE